jgi:excisionase family DNA binding protein
VNLLTTEEAAERLNVSERTLRREVADGKMWYVSIGRSVRFCPEDVDNYKRGMACKPAWWPRVWQWDTDCHSAWVQEPWKHGYRSIHSCTLAGKRYWLRSPSHIEKNAKPASDVDQAEGGVYFWFRDRELRYIGIAGVYANRFVQHGNRLDYWNRVFLLPLWREAAQAVEGYYIRTLQPPENISDGDQTLWELEP